MRTEKKRKRNEKEYIHIFTRQLESAIFLEVASKRAHMKADADFSSAKRDQ